jgi:hypothetical protein
MVTYADTRGCPFQLIQFEYKDDRTALFIMVDLLDHLKGIYPITFMWSPMVEQTSLDHRPHPLVSTRMQARYTWGNPKATVPSTMQI